MQKCEKEVKNEKAKHGLNSKKMDKVNWPLIFERPKM